MSSFTTPNYEAINGAGVLAFEASGLLDQLKTDLAATAVPAVNAALEVVKCLSENVGQWIEVYTLELLPFILDNLANSMTAEAAMTAGSAILKTRGHSLVRSTCSTHSRSPVPSIQPLISLLNLSQ